MKTKDGIAVYWAEKAAQFHAENPHVYERLKNMALKMRATGRTRYGIKVLYNALRWARDLETTDDTPFKLNDAYHAWYARKLMEENPALEGFFELRYRMENAA